jgi:predicted amidohydrolase
MGSSQRLRCCMAQLNLVVGDVDGNTSRNRRAADRARDELKADVVLLPELAVSGYPPEDLLFHTGHAPRSRSRSSGCGARCAASPWSRAIRNTRARGSTIRRS